MDFATLPHVEYLFRDQDDTIADCGMYFAMDSDRDSLWAAVRAETRIAAISQCPMIGYRMTLGSSHTSIEQPTGSNLSFAFIILHSLNGTYTTLPIPGIRTDILLQDGPFMLQKLDMLHPDVIALANGVLAAQLVTERGDPVDLITSGGAMNIWTETQRRSG